MGTRLKCVFRVENDGKAMGRSANGFVALGCERSMSTDGVDNKKFYLLLTTRQNKGHPRKIKLVHFNCLFDQMKRNGMATIQFVDPHLTVYISKADPKMLFRFLNHLNELLLPRNDVNGCSSAFPRPPIPTVSNAQRQCTSAIAHAKPTKLCIHSRQQYQSMIKQGSANLQRLDIIGIGLLSVDIRWFGMRNLQHLSLVGNKLGTDEWCTERNWRQFTAISKLQQLHTLDLSQNEFKHMPQMFIDALPVTLVNLNLAFNCLIHLTNRISRLQKLVTLRLDENPLEELPEDLCLIDGLRELSLVGLKQLQFWPYSLCAVKFSAPRFNLLDLSGNENSPFITGHRKKSKCMVEQIQQVHPSNCEAETAATVSTKATAPPKLCEFAAAAVLNNNKFICSGSCLLRPAVADCLPLFVCRWMRRGLRRCSRCCRLFPVSSSFNNDDGIYQRVDLRRYANAIYGSSWAFSRVNLCGQRKCIFRNVVII